MCYHGKKTDSMCYNDKNSFLVPFFFKIVQSFHGPHIKSIIKYQTNVGFLHPWKTSTNLCFLTFAWYVEMDDSSKTE